MRKQNLSNLTSIPGFETDDIILLGDAEIQNKTFFERIVVPKIKRENTDKIPGFWGYLSKIKDQPVSWKGEIQFSNYGNDDSRGVTLEEIRLIHQANPHLQFENLKVIEYFISFEHVDIDFPKQFNINELPRFELNVFLNKNEGALVYYQYYDKHDSENDGIQYILPEATSEDNSLDRDRLKYIVETVPKQVVEEDAKESEKSFKLSNQDSKIKFVLKILTYKRGGFINSQEAVARQVANLAIGSLQNDFEKHPVLKLFLADKNDFKVIQGGKVNLKAKTLLLIHGTFGSTQSSFKALYKNSDWLKNLIDHEIYQQIIAFDYPTVFKDAKENVNILNSFFKGKQFKYPVDIIGTSQGGLLAQQLANLDDPKRAITAGKIITVASANGVDYLLTAANLGKLLGIYKAIAKMTGRPTAAFIAALAQHSIDWIIKQPGLEQMSPKSERLKKIMDGKPYDEDTLYLPIPDDFTRELVAHDNIFKRWAALGLDLITRAIMGKHNDWVVRSENQFIVPKDYCAIDDYEIDKYENYIIAAIHGKCLDKDKAQHRILDFLTQ